MDYTKQVREHCGKHSKGWMNILVVRNTVFANSSYKTPLNNYNRLDLEGVVIIGLIGVYNIDKKKIDERKIFSEYTSNEKGRAVGYALFNKIELAVYQDERIVIYTNVIKTKQKDIGNLSLKKADLIFLYEIIALILLLEILGIVFEKRGGDCLIYGNVGELLAKTYTEDNLKQGIGAVCYKHSTITKPHECLTRLNVKSTCLDFSANNLRKRVIC